MSVAPSRVLVCSLVAVALSAWTCGATSAGASGPPAADGVTLAGFAFVDSSVTSHGSGATLPEGTKIYPAGSTITGTTGCPNRYRTSGLIVAVMDYQGPSSSGNLIWTRHAQGQPDFTRAPYYFELDPGRKLQYLGPVFENGTYDVEIVWDYSHGAAKKTFGTLTLDRDCHL